MLKAYKSDSYELKGDVPKYVTIVTEIGGNPLEVQKMYYSYTNELSNIFFYSSDYNTISMMSSVIDGIMVTQIEDKNKIYLSGVVFQLDKKFEVVGVPSNVTQINARGNMEALNLIFGDKDVVTTNNVPGGFEPYYIEITPYFKISDATPLTIIIHGGKKVYNRTLYIRQVKYKSGGIKRRMKIASLSVIKTITRDQITDEGFIKDIDFTSSNEGSNFYGRTKVVKLTVDGVVIDEDEVDLLDGIGDGRLHVYESPRSRIVNFIVRAFIILGTFFAGGWFLARKHKHQ